MSRWAATSSIHRDVIHAHGQAGSTQKSTTGVVGFSDTIRPPDGVRVRPQSHPAGGVVARRVRQVSTWDDRRRPPATSCTARRRTRVPAENLTRAEARERAALVTTESYDVRLDLTTGPTTFASRTVLRFAARVGASTFVALTAPTVHEITLNGRSLDVAAVFADSRIALADLAEQNELVVVADCAYMNTGEGLHRFVDPVDGEAYLYSQFEVADSRRVFAVFEQPDLMATYAFTVTAPAHWEVVSVSPTPQPEPA